MNLNTNALRVSSAAWLALGAVVSAQPAVPPQAIEQFEHVVGNRVEAVTILGGDYGAAGGIYTFRHGAVADLRVSKIGGGGEVASPRPLAGGVQWAPVAQGNLGFISSENRFETGYLAGNRMLYDTLGVQAGGGARFYFTDHLSLAPTLSAIYGHTENEFKAGNALGESVEAAATGRYVNWHLDTWSIVPAVDARYEWHWGRTLFQFTSRYNFFHTESFHSSSPLVTVEGDSYTWENKIDADVPLGCRLFGLPLHTGGFFSRTELFGGVADGLNASHLYTANGRLVLAGEERLWKLHWIGLGVSYFAGGAFDGWSAGVDIRFKF